MRLLNFSYPWHKFKIFFVFVIKAVFDSPLINSLSLWKLQQHCQNRVNTREYVYIRTKYNYLPSFSKFCSRKETVLTAHWAERNSKNLNWYCNYNRNRANAARRWPTESSNRQLNHQLNRANNSNNYNNTNNSKLQRITAMHPMLQSLCLPCVLLLLALLSR